MVQRRKTSVFLMRVIVTMTKPSNISSFEDDLQPVSFFVNIDRITEQMDINYSIKLNQAAD